MGLAWSNALREEGTAAGSSRAPLVVLGSGSARCWGFDNSPGPWQPAGAMPQHRGLMGPFHQHFLGF